MATAPLLQNSNISSRIEDDLIGLVTSRICHDLVSPIGAIDNGVELMTALSGTSHSAEMGLIGQSARAAGLKLRLFRIAFGAASPDAVSRGEDLRQVFEGTFNRSRLKFSWVDQTTALSRPQAKLLALSLLCADTAMPFGGLLTLTVHDSGVTLTMSSERFRWQDDLWAALCGDGTFTDVGAGNVQFPLARLHADQMGRQFALHEDTQGWLLSV